MKKTDKLFAKPKKDIYNLDDKLFFESCKENCIFEYENNPVYKGIMDKLGFDVYKVNKTEDIPFIPTMYFKHHDMLTFDKKKYAIKGTSSGTSGVNVSTVGMTYSDIFRGFNMVRRVFSFHKILTFKPHRYIILGYEPNKNNERAISKTSYGYTLLSPAVSRDYALKYTKDGYKPDIEGLEEKFIKYSKGKIPVRTLGFPSYTYFLMKDLKEKGIKVKLPKGSSISISGGWKSFYKERVDKQVFYDLASEVFGIDDKDIYEYYGAVEHPILYVDCRYHHFHIPEYARVIIRDIETLKPVKDGEVGLVNLVTPMIFGTPTLSVMTDDLGIVHSEKCPCGCPSKYFEILGRSGIDDIKTCAQGADEVLKGGDK